MRAKLRQRVALALSEILVVSDQVRHVGGIPHALSNYYDTLLAHAFGNYRDLLRAITLHPAMGVYLEPCQQRQGKSPGQYLPGRELRSRGDAVVLHRAVRTER